MNGPEDVLNWGAIDWRAHERNVWRLRQRIFKAVREGDWRKVRNLQKLMLRSRSNTLVSVRQVTRRNAGFAFGPPKSDAGKRVVVIPEVIMPAVRQHMSWVAQPGEETLVFATVTGAPLRHSNFRRRVWLPALREAGLPTIHFHDLRHTGNELAATAGAGLRELMDRMGHSTSRAALVYLHGSKERQQAIADALSQFTTDALKGHPVGPSGTQRARKRRPAS